MSDELDSPMKANSPGAKVIETLMAKLWESNLPVLHERLALLDRAAAEARAGSLDQPLREEAISTAHKLAGSLGMFGYAEGTECARRIELQLRPPAAVNAARLGTDVADLRAAVNL